MLIVLELLVRPSDNYQSKGARRNKQAAPENKMKVKEEATKNFQHEHEINFLGVASYRAHRFYRDAMGAFFLVENRQDIDRL